VASHRLLLGRGVVRSSGVEGEVQMGIGMKGSCLFSSLRYRSSDARGSRPMKAARRSQSSASGGGGTSAPKGDPVATMSRYSGFDHGSRPVERRHS